jgi:hypothetical protein
MVEEVEAASLAQEVIRKGRTDVVYMPSCRQLKVTTGRMAI